MTGIFTALVSELGRDDIWLHLGKWCSFILPASLQAVRKKKETEFLELFCAPLNLFFRTDLTIHLICKEYCNQVLVFEMQ